MSPLSMASVRSQGATEPASPRYGSMSSGPRRAPALEGGAEHLEQGGEPAHVFAQVGFEEGGGPGVEGDRSGLDAVVDEGLRRLALD